MTEDNDSREKAKNSELQRRLQILREELEAGHVKFASGLKVIESLKKVRYSLDGSVDLSTVDASVRSIALAVTHHRDREEMKKTHSLAEIQNTYFDFLYKNFGVFYEIMVERGLTPHDAGMAASENKDAVKSFAEDLPAFLETIREFWNQLGDIAAAHVEDMSGSLKGIFGGDLFPSAHENIASKCGVYTDTIVLPDPFLRSLDLFSRWDPKQKTYYLVKHGLNLLQYRELACADIYPPIVVILPEIETLNQSEKDFVTELGTKDALVHAETIYGRPFESLQDLMKYSNSLNTIDAVIAAAVSPSRIVFDVEWGGTLKDQLSRATKDIHAKLIGTSHPGILVASQLVGRFGVTNELLLKARRLRGTPIIDAPTSWQYLVWKLEYDAAKTERDLQLSDLHIVKGLQAAEDKTMQWLGRVPPKALLEIRKSEAIPELRAIIGKGVEELANARPTDFHATGERVFHNIEAALADHSKRIDELTAKRWRFAGVDIGSVLVTGTLAVTAAVTGSPEWTLAAYAADQVLDPPKLKELPDAIRKLKQEGRDLKQSPVGMLFKYKDAD